MNAIYEKPEAEIVDFHALQNLAVIDDEDHVKDDETGHTSRDF